MANSTFNILAECLESGAQGDGRTTALVLVIQARGFAARETHTAADLRAFADFARHALTIVDANTALAVARLAAARPDCPAVVIDSLLARNDRARAFVLRRAPSLSPLCRAVALTGERGDAVAMARRSDLARDELLLLLARGEPKVTLALLDNANAALPEEAKPGLVALARKVVAIGRKLLDREREFGGPSSGLFLSASRGERADMIARAKAQARLDNRLPARLPTPATRQALLGAISTWDGAWLAALIGEALRLDPDIAAGIVADPGGEAFIVALLAIGAADLLTEVDLLAIASRNDSARTAHDLVALQRDLDAATAMRLMAQLGAASFESGAKSEATLRVANTRPGRPAEAGLAREKPAGGNSDTASRRPPARAIGR